MARACYFCERGTLFGNNVPRKGLPRRKGGGGEHRGVHTRRTFKVNLRSMQSVIDGTARRVKVCMRCLKSGSVVKVPFYDASIATQNVLTKN